MHSGIRPHTQTPKGLQVGLQQVLRRDTDDATHYQHTTYNDAKSQSRGLIIPSWGVGAVPEPRNHTQTAM